MAKILLLAAVCLGSGFVGALLALELSAGDSPEAGVPGPPATAAATDLEDLIRRLDRIEDRLARGPFPSESPAGSSGERLPASEMSDRLAELERRLAAGARPSSSSETLAPLAADASPERILVRAKELGSKLGQWDRSRDLLKEILEAGLSQKTRMDALWQLGVAERVLEDYAAADGAFFELLQLAGNDSQRGVEALFQLAWTQSIAGDQGKATAYMEDVLRSPATTAMTAASARISIAKFAVLRGDKDRARAELTKVIEEHGGEEVTPGLQHAVNEAKLLLGQQSEGESDGR